MEKVTGSASASETKTNEVGVQIKGEEFVLISAPEICFSCPSEDASLIMADAANAVTDNDDTDLKIKPCGDGLYYFGGDLFCTYELLGTTITENFVVFNYAPYTITVSWTNGGDGVRKNPTWQRQYK